MEILLFSILIIIIIILSAIASGTEAALLSVSYPKVKELSKSKNKKINKKAIILLKIKNNIQKYITGIVIFNNFVNIIGSIYVGVLASEIFGKLYLGLVSGCLTFLIIIFSEIIPKIYCEKNAKTISLNIAKPVFFFTKIISPIIYVLNKITGIFIKNKNLNSVSEGEIKEMANIGNQEGTINSYESEIIRNVFEMNDLDAYDVMVPISKVKTINNNSNFETIVKLITESGHTRFPVKNGDEIIGIINAKDLFKYFEKIEKFNIHKILRPVIYASENMKLSTLETKLKNQRIHMAIIVNEFGEVSGIVTLEDIIEEIIGEIEDEFDHPEENKIIEISKNKFHIKGNYDIEELNKKFNLKIENLENEEFNTINGFFTSKFERICKVNDKIKLNNCSFRVIKASKRQVLEVELIIK